MTEPLVAFLVAFAIGTVAFEWLYEKRRRRKSTAVTPPPLRLIKKETP